MADNSTAFSLPQPHLQRTRLCELNDIEFNEGYVERRDQLKKIIASMVTSKLVQGKQLNGKEFAIFIKQIVEALNKGEIPSAGSVVDSFNKALVERCLSMYEKRIADTKLPMPEQRLEELHSRTASDVVLVFEKERFGRHSEGSLNLLSVELRRAFKSLQFRNEFESTKECENAYYLCEKKLDGLQEMRIPSISKFTSGLGTCSRTHEVACVGPSRSLYEQRMQKMLSRSRLAFINNYNNRLFNWMVIFSLAMVVVGRFLMKCMLLELAAWAFFIFLEAYTRLFWSAESLFYNRAWQTLVMIWESLVYNALVDLDRWAIPIVSVALTILVFLQVYRRRNNVLPLVRTSVQSRPYSRPRRSAQL